MLKSPARVGFFKFLLFLENRPLQNCSLTFVSPFGGLYTTLIIVILVFLLHISIDIDSIASQFIDFFLPYNQVIHE